MKYLFISPHPDDAEFGCGGTIAKFANMGRECHIAVMCGPSDLTMVHSGHTIPWEQRKKEQLDASRELGVYKTLFLDVAPASKMDTVSLSVGVSKLDELLHEERYAEVYAPLPSANQDHMYVWNAVMAAFRPTKVDRVNLFGYEQATQYHGPQVDGAVRCSMYMSLNEENLTDKINALHWHKSQVEGRENTIAGTLGVSQLAIMRGSEAGCKYAERFLPVRIVR